MTKDEFLAAWEEVCVEAAAEALQRGEDGGMTPIGAKWAAETAYRAIGSKLLSGLEQKAWWDEKLQGIAKSEWRGATEDDEPLFRLTLPKE